MRSLLFVINFFIFNVMCQKYGLYHFRDKEFLVDCIAEYFRSARNYSKPPKNFMYDLKNFMVPRTLTKEELNMNFKITNNLEEETPSSFALQNNRVLKRQLEDLFRSALLHCSQEVESFKYKNISDDLMIREVLPYFAEERSDHALILDYVLVNWPSYLAGMIRMQRTRSILRSYVNDILKILESSNPDRIMISSSGRHSSKDIDRAIRRLWTRRSQLFFDHRNPGMQYVDHIYTKNYLFPHTHGDISQFIGLHTENLNERDPRVSRERVKEILNIHPLINPYVRSENDPFYSYRHFGMTSAEYYLERHINDFYRAIFFVLELQARGIVNDEDDTFLGPIPNHVLFDDVQKIVYDDEAYREYLLHLTNMFLNNNPENAYELNILRSRRFREIDLIMLFLRRIRCRTRGTKTTTTTTTTESSSTTSNYHDMVKTGAIPKSGKYYTRTYKSCKNSFDSTYSRRQSSENSNSKQMKNDDLYYSHLDYDVDILKQGESSFFFRVLHGSFLEKTL